MISVCESECVSDSESESVSGSVRVGDFVRKIYIYLLIKYNLLAIAEPDV